MWGFRQAKGLGSKAWLQVGASGDGEAIASLALIGMMNDIGEGVSDLAGDAPEELRRSATDLIPDSVRTLGAWALSRGFGGEPCPCASGRTYERCCGSN